MPPKVITEVPLKLVPVIVMSVPAAAVVGANAVIVGAGMKVNPSNEAVPPGVVKLTAPDEPAPTMAIIEVEETTVNDVTDVPPNVIADVPLKLVPVIVMSVPAAAVVGANAVIVGAGMKVNPSNEAVPPGVVRLAAPEEPLPTIATIVDDDTTVNALTEVPPSVTTEVPLKLVPVIVMSVPTAAVVGENAVIVGAGMKVKPSNEAVPPGVVKLTAPDEPAPTMAIIEVEETTVNDVTDVPPNVIADVPLKLVPVIVMSVPAAAVVGANAVIVGAGMKVNPSNEAVPPGVVRLAAPEEPLPTIATIVDDDTTVNALTEVPPSVTTEVPLKLVPVIVMSVPTAAVVGENAVIVGAGMKVKPSNEAVPPGVVKLTAPDEPAPTMAIIEVEETTVNDVTDVPPNVIADVPLKLVPVIVMSVPAAAVVGANAVIVGAGMKVNPSNEAVPPGVVRLTAPVDPLPTIAIMEVEETTVNELTGVPPNVMVEVLLKLVPVMVIKAPAAAVVGANAVIVGAGMNVNPSSEAVPPGVVKLTAPEEPLPTIATIVDDDTTVNELTEVPPRVITEVLSKYEPVMVISDPVAAAVGLKLVMIGAGINEKPDNEASQPTEITLTKPDEPVPTLALMEPEYTTVKDSTGVPPKLTAEVLEKLEPVIVITAPAPAAVG